MRGLTPTAVFSESRGGGGTFPVPFTVRGKKFQNLVSVTVSVFHKVTFTGHTKTISHVKQKSAFLGPMKRVKESHTSLRDMSGC